MRRVIRTAPARSLFAETWCAETRAQIADRGPGFGAEASCTLSALCIARRKVVTTEPGSGEHETVAVEPIDDAAPAGAGAFFERRQQAIPHRAVKLSLGGIEFLGSSVSMT